MEVIAAHYDFLPTGFSFGEQRNEAGTNEGSCKILAFAQANQLTPQRTLHLFGDYYRVDFLILHKSYTSPNLYLQLIDLNDKNHRSFSS